MKDIIKTLKAANNEGTRSPYWAIVDPVQNMSCDIDIAAGQITGIFFSRNDAEEYLRSKRYNFSKRARVYCFSGHCSLKYENLFNEFKED